MPEEKLPPLPRLSLAAITKTRDRIVDEAAYDHYEDAIVGDKLRRFAGEIAAILKPRGVDLQTVLASCAEIRGQDLTQRRLRTFAWRLASNIDRLKAGYPLGPLRTPREAAWMPIQVGSALPGCDHKSRFGADFTATALAGTYATGRLTWFWTRTAYLYIARSAGFTGSGGRQPCQHPTQFVGLRLFAWVDPALSRDGSPAFRTVAVSPSMLAYNNEILAIRFRLDRQCPLGFDGENFLACHFCSAGARECAAACHPVAYESGLCAKCGQVDAVFDPKLPGDACINCVVAARLAKDGKR